MNFDVFYIFSENAEESWGVSTVKQGLNQCGLMTVWKDLEELNLNCRNKIYGKKVSQKPLLKNTQKHLSSRN